MPVRQRALDPEGLPGADKRLTGERPPQRLDRRSRQLADVRDRDVVDALALADATPHQRRDVLALAVAPLDRGHMHRWLLLRHQKKYACAVGQHSWLHN